MSDVLGLAGHLVASECSGCQKDGLAPEAEVQSEKNCWCTAHFLCIKVLRYLYRVGTIRFVINA